MLKTLGTISWGLDLGRAVFSQLEYVASHGNKNQQLWVPKAPTAKLTSDVVERSSLFLEVDVLTIDYPYNANTYTYYQRIRDNIPSTQPLIIIESWPEFYVIQENENPMNKSEMVYWKRKGYDNTARYLNATEQGGAINQKRYLVTRYKQPFKIMWRQPESLSKRPMSNLLRPYGIPNKNWSDRPGIPHTDAMPCQPGSIISVKGRAQKLLADKVALGLGVPNNWMPWLKRMPVKIPANFHNAVMNTTACVLFESIIILEPQKTSKKQAVRTNIQPVYLVTDNKEWNWTVPDLSEKSEWYNQQHTKLLSILDSFPTSARLHILQKSLQALKYHRSNYTSEGPKPTHLQLLWWEWPSEHWIQLLYGCSANFMKEPQPYIYDAEENKFDDTQLATIDEFLNELIELGTLLPVPNDFLHCTAPLFCLPKQGQPGQWRIIADFRRGGQNECIGTDPCYLRQIAHIFPYLYCRGYS